MTLYAETVYYCNLGETIEIVPTTINNISFIYCKQLPRGLSFNKRNGIISGIYDKENYLELKIKYRKNNTKVISELIKISIKKREPLHMPELSINLEDIIEINQSEPIAYYLSENDNSHINEEPALPVPVITSQFPIENIDSDYKKPIVSKITQNNEEKIKKSIHDLSLTKTIKFMCINSSNQN
uniref:Uncharacterized protein n=1 Tax=viral metagenome TaxID=1070528 RepID=A0A6C0D664_9ZZZZ